VPEEEIDPGADAEKPSPDEDATSEPSAPESASAESGWYPDPSTAGSGRLRFWDGGGWTEQIKSASGAPGTATVSGGVAPPVIAQVEALSTTTRSPAERKAILAQQLQTAAARGLRIESQSDFQAVLISGKPVNNTLHAILTIFTCLLWGIVWAIVAGTGGESREMVVVDEFGNVQHQRLGKA
jgi:hypothetical protein